MLSGFRRKPQGNNYLKSEMHLSAIPGRNCHQGGQGATRKNRLARFRQMLQGKSRTGQGDYKRSISKRIKVVKLAGLAAAALFLAVFILAGGRHLALQTLQLLPHFRVSEIVVSGTKAVSQEKLREAAGITLHRTSLIGLSCSQVEKTLATVPWVARAEVKRNWPSTVEISIVENEAVALLHSTKATDAPLQYIDRHGVPFLTVRFGVEVDFPVITGLAEIEEPAVRQKALAEALIFLKSVSGSNPNLPAESVSEIHLNGQGEMVIYLVDHPFPIFFGASNTAKKFSRLVQVLKTLYKKENGKDAISRVEYIQMDYLNDKVLVVQNESG